MTIGRSLLRIALALGLLAATPIPLAAAEEVRFCVTVRSDAPVEGDILAAVAAGEATILIEAPEACALPVAATEGPEILAGLQVAPEDPDGYDRDRFRHWVDADGDGCDTRREVLIEESLSEVTVGPGCKLAGGSWVSVFDAVETTDAAALDIDHVVPLAEAWRSGAGDWTDARRERFANDLSDPRTLRAVTAGSNRSKGDRDPAEWLPPDEASHCQYAADWVAIKDTWDLSVDPAERDALALILDDC